jgi:hypothetical protein
VDHDLWGDIDARIEKAVLQAFLEREQRLTLGRKDWLQMVGLLVMLLVQTIYVTSEWAELKAGIEANSTAIVTRTEDRFTRTEATGVLGVISHRVGELEERGAKLETLISGNAKANSELAQRVGELLAEMRALRGSIGLSKAQEGK